MSLSCFPSPKRESLTSEYKNYMNQFKVLLLDGHTIQSLPFLEAFNKLGAEITLFCEKKLSYGYFSRYKKRTIICPPIHHNTEEYKDFLLKHLQNNRYDIIIPLFNDTAEFASKHKSLIEQTGSKVEIPDWDIFIRAHDKEKLMDICREIGIPHPKTANPSKTSYEEAIAYVGYPCLIKPNISAGARGIKVIHNKDEFDAHYNNIVEQFGESTIQEFIPQTGKQLNVQIYRDKTGAVVASSCYEKTRYYPIDGGTATCNKIIDRPDLVEKYMKILDYLGWEGAADFDCIEDPRTGVDLLMEINPRVPGTVKASFLAGINFAEIMMHHAKNIPFKKYEYKHGFYMRNFGTELIWFLASKDRFKCTPNWFNFLGKDIYYVDGSFADPMPFIGGLLSGAKKLLNPEFRKSKKK